MQDHQRTYSEVSSLRYLKSHSIRLVDIENFRQGRTSQHEITNSDAAETTRPTAWRSAVAVPEGTCHTEADADKHVARSRLARGAWFGAGWLAVAAGGIGVVVPGLPTTGFMIIAAACFARCSPRFEQWVLDLPGVGRSVADYRSGLGMPKRAKIAAVSMMMVAISISVGLLLDNTTLRIVIVAAGLIGTWYIVRRVPTGPANNSTAAGGPA